jgi:hypothetical protein
MYVSDVPTVFKRTVGKLAVSDRVGSYSACLTAERHSCWSHWTPNYPWQKKSRLLHRTVRRCDPGTVGYCCTSFNIQLTIQVNSRQATQFRTESEMIGAYSHLPHYMWRSGGYVPLFPLWHCYSNQLNWRSFIGPYVGPLIIGVTWQCEGLMCGVGEKLNREGGDAGCIR